MWFHLSLSHKKFVTETVGCLTASSGAASLRADTRTVKALRNVSALGKAVALPGGKIFGTCVYVYLEKAA